MNLRPRRRPVPTIPIVSLIDIMVILLIFFIATTTFKKQKVEVKITLPESKALGGATSAPEIRTTITVTKEQKLFLDANPVELEADTDANLGMLVKIWGDLREPGYSSNDVPARIQRAAGQ